MYAPRHDFVIEQGADFLRRLLWREKESQSPLDLSGYTARMMLKSGYDATAPVLELTTANGRIFLGGETGEITLHLTAAETADLPIDTPAADRLPHLTRLIYDLELEAPDGTVTRLLQGQALVSAEVTRDA